MNWTRLLVVAVAGLLLIGGVTAAAPGNAPADAGEDRSNETTDTDSQGDRTGQPGPPGEIGPPGGLPDPVPDFVSGLLDRIAQGVNGLGAALADLTPGGSTDAPGQN